jgi:hypothetical protein
MDPLTLVPTIKVPAPRLIPVGMAGLRRMLGDMMRRLGDGQGDIPEPLGRAERAMRDATEALQRRQPGEARAVE